jgi:hypothetical protein
VSVTTGNKILNSGQIIVAAQHPQLGDGGKVHASDFINLLSLCGRDARLAAPSANK